MEPDQMIAFFRRFLVFAGSSPRAAWTIHAAWDHWVAEKVPEAVLQDFSGSLCVPAKRSEFERRAEEEVRQAFGDEHARLVLMQLAYVSVFADQGVFNAWLPEPSVAIPILTTPPGESLDDDIRWPLVAVVPRLRGDGGEQVVGVHIRATEQAWTNVLGSIKGMLGPLSWARLTSGVAGIRPCSRVTRVAILGMSLLALLLALSPYVVIWSGWEMRERTLMLNLWSLTGAAFLLLIVYASVQFQNVSYEHGLAKRIAETGLFLGVKKPEDRDELTPTKESLDVGLALAVLFAANRKWGNPRALMSRALSDAEKQVKNWAVTGVLSGMGRVTEVDRLLDKYMAAWQAGLRFFAAPACAAVEALRRRRPELMGRHPALARRFPAPEVIGYRSLAGLVWRLGGIRQWVSAVLLAAMVLGWLLVAVWVVPPIVPGAAPSRQFARLGGVPVGPIREPVFPVVYRELALRFPGCRAGLSVSLRSPYYAHREVPIDKECWAKIDLMPPDDLSVGGDEDSIVRVNRLRMLPGLTLPPSIMEEFSFWRLRQQYQQALRKAGK